MEKIKDTKATKIGGSMFIPLPLIWVKDLGLNTRDQVEIYRDSSGGADRLIIQKKPNSQ